MPWLAWEMLRAGPKPGPRLCFWPSQGGISQTGLKSQYGLSPCSWFLSTSHSFSHSCPFPTCRKTWQLPQPHLVGLTNGWGFLQGFLGNKMDLSAAIFIEYSEFTGDIFMSSSLSPREDHVFRSMTEEQTLLSHNTRPWIIFPSYQTHCWLWSQAQKCHLTLKRVYHYMLRPSLYTSTCICLLVMFIVRNWCKAAPFLSKIHIPVCQSCHIFPQEFLQGKSEGEHEKSLPLIWTKVNQATNCSGRYGINLPIPRSRWW